jgi:hypothetical protein
MLKFNIVHASLIVALFSAATMPAGARAAEAAGPDAVSAAAGSAVVKWSRPRENTDGSPLTNLAGYVLYYGRGSSVPSSAIYIEPSATALEIQNLSPGNWHFQIESVNSEGIQSELSPTVFKKIQAMTRQDDLE